MRISASIVVYRESPQVLERVLSCFERMECDREVIVVDNSPDRRLESVAVAFASARYFHAEGNPGFGAGHNFAFAHRRSDSQIHLVVNPDTWFEPQMIAEMARWHLSEPGIALSVPRILNPDGTTQFACRHLPTPLSMLVRRLNVGGMFERAVAADELGRVDRKAVYDVPFCHGCFLMMRSDIYEKLGGFDEGFFLYMEDADLFIRAKRFGRTVQNPRFEVFHEFRRGSAQSPKLLWHHLRSAVRFFGKHGVRSLRQG